MGEIVSIKRSSDEDLFALFEQSCPVVPGEVNEKVQQAASRALGGVATQASQSSFKVVCVVVAAACLVGLALVRGVTTRWNNAVDSASAYAVQDVAVPVSAGAASRPELAAALPAASGNGLNSEDSWRRSRGAWAEYIARLERDPFYQYVLQEKKRFAERYPEASAAGK